MTGVAIQSLPAGAGDARRLAARLGVPLHEIALHRFPDGELRVTVGPAAPTTIIYASLDQPNDKLLAMLFAAEALRRGGARRLVLVAPYLCYMRQDTAFHEGEAISQKVIGRLIAATVDRVITVDAHLHRTARYQSGVSRHRGRQSVGHAGHCRRAAPDRDRSRNGRGRSRRGVAPLGERSRRPARARAHGGAERSAAAIASVEISFAEPALLAGRPVLLVDDIVSSGGTLIACAKALMAAGATTIDAVITHALFPPDMATGVCRRRHPLRPLDLQRAASHQCDRAR